MKLILVKTLVCRLVFCFVTFAHFINGSQKPFYKFQRRPTLDNHKCVYSEQVFRVRGLNNMGCLMRCLSASKCYTAFFSTEEQKCIGCKKVFTSTATLTTISGYTALEFVPVCPSGWVGYQRSCYRLSSPGSFDNGANECEQIYGSRAVHIETAEENEFLKSFILDDGTTWGYFIGTTNCDTPGVWKYHNTNTNATFLDFEATEGNDLDVCCSLFYTGFANVEWADWSCTQNPFPTICEREIDVIV